MSSLVGLNVSIPIMNTNRSNASILFNNIIELNNIKQPNSISNNIFGYFTNLKKGTTLPKMQYK